MKIAQWHRDRREDLDQAEEAAARAVLHCPASVDALALLISLQRRSPSWALVESLHAIDALTENNLDPLHEAAEVALAVEEEKQLHARFGEGYAEYCQDVPRFNVIVGLLRQMKSSNK